MLIALLSTSKLYLYIYSFIIFLYILYFTIYGQFDISFHKLIDQINVFSPGTTIETVSQ